MGPIDRMMKFLAQQRPADFVALFAPSPRDVELIDLDKSQVFERKDTDTLFRVSSGDQTFILHLEYVSDWRPADEVAQLAKAALAHQLFYPLKVRSAAIVFKGPGREMRSTRTIHWSPGSPACIFHYEVVQIGNATAASLLALDIPLLWALVPFCADGGTEVALLGAIERIKRTASLKLAERRDLLAAIHVGAEHRGVLKMIHSHIGMDVLEQSSLYRTALDKGLKLGRDQGLLTGLQKALLTMVDKRFGPLPEPMVRRIRAIDQPTLLQDLLLRLDECADLEAFEAALPKGRASSS